MTAVGLATGLSGLVVAATAASIPTAERPPVRAVGPGAVAVTVAGHGYLVRALVRPNRAAASNSIALEVRRDGRPVRHAVVTLSLAMLDMAMPPQRYQLSQTAPGSYTRRLPTLAMAGRWQLTLTVRGGRAPRLTAVLVDDVEG